MMMRIQYHTLSHTDDFAGISLSILLSRSRGRQCRAGRTMPPGKVPLLTNAEEMAIDGRHSTTRHGFPSLKITDDAAKLSLPHDSVAA